MYYGKAVLRRDEDKSIDAYIGSETLDRKIAAMNLYYRRGAGSDRAPVVIVVSAICRSDFHELRPAARHDVRNAKAASDLNELPARNQHFFLLRKRIQGQNHCGSAVVD